MKISYLMNLYIRSVAPVAAVIMVIAVVTISSSPSQDLPKLISVLHVHGKTEALWANKRVFISVE